MIVLRSQADSNHSEKNPASSIEVKRFLFASTLLSGSSAMAALKKTTDQPSRLESKFQGKNEQFKAPGMRKSPLEETFFVSLGSILERLEINPPSRVQRRLLQITHTGTDSGFYRASHRTGVSCLSSGEVTRRNPRLCLFFC